MTRYIHEQEEWPHFRWDQKSILPLLAAVRYHQGKLLGQMESLGFTLQEEAVLQTLTEDVVQSSSIEGERLDKARVRSSLARRLGLDAGALLPADRNVEGVVEMLLDATQRYAEPLTEERLLGWQAALFPTGYSGLGRVRVGAWRDDTSGPMQVVSGPIDNPRVHFEAPAASRLSGEMAGFMAWFNDGSLPLDGVLKAGVAHLWFVTLHPFDDGNGRVARAIADLSLARSEETGQRFYSLSAQIRTDRKAYYDILESTQSGSLDITRWLLWFLGCLERALLEAGGTLETVLRKALFWKTHAQADLNERQHLMLNRLLDGFTGKMTSSKWAILVRCSQDTALRDISDLVERGILRREAAGGRSTSYVLDYNSKREAGGLEVEEELMECLLPGERRDSG